MAKRIVDKNEHEWEIVDSGYGKKPATSLKQKSYYVKTDTKGLKMWVLYEKIEEKK